MKKTISLLLCLCMVAALLPTMAFAAAGTDYDILSDDVSESANSVNSVLAGVAAVEKDPGTGVVTIKLTQDVCGRLHFGTDSIMGGMEGNFVLDLDGHTIDPGGLDESICLDHGFEGTLTITGEGTIKTGNNNIIYFGWNAQNINFDVAEGKDYFTLKDGDRSVLGAVKNSTLVEGNWSFRGTALVMKQYNVGTYTVSFDPNGGMGTMPAQTVADLEKTALNANAFTKEGCAFLGWAEASDGAVVYDDGEEITDIAEQNETVTLYAVWQDARHIHPVCGDDACTDINHTDITWTAWEATNALPEAEGNYYLTQDVTLVDAEWHVPGAVNLCLNGYTIEKNNGPICWLENGTTLSICDCGTGGLLTVPGNSVNFKGNDCVVNVYGGTLYSNDENTVIDGNEFTGNVFNLYGGSVINAATSAAISAHQMTVNLYGGEVAASNKNGINVFKDGRINLCGNTAITHGDGYDHIKASGASCVDATNYTGSDITILYSNENAAIGDVIVMNVTDSTADKFAVSEINEGYMLEREENNLVYAKVPVSKRPHGGLTAVTVGEESKAEEKEPEKPVEPSTPTVPKFFKDVTSADWFYGDVKYVFENGLMSGTSEENFAPNAKLTRAMLVTVLYRMEGEPATNRSIPFADMDMGAYYASAVIWAQQNGIVNGVSETEFAPDAEITREQMAAIMFRYAQYKGMDAVTLEENLHFADASEISEYAVSAMNWAVGTGLLKGKTASSLNPKDGTTRAETAAILHRYIENNK